MRPTSLLPLATLLVGACAESSDTGTTAQAVGPVVHHITIRADGSFSPEQVDVDVGDSVVWDLPSRGDAIVRATWNGSAYAAVPYDPGQPFEVTGPMPVSPGGIFTLSPNPKPPGYGLWETSWPTCLGFEQRMVGPDGTRLCSAATVGATMPATWDDPAITGVFIRLRWSTVDRGPMAANRYDWTALDREIDQAVAHGKLYSIAFEAGRYGTPEWLFTDLGMPKLDFENAGSGLPCGTHPCMSLPPVWLPTYRDAYNDMLWALADHLKADAGRYRALAYVKPSGANLFTTEARLPRGCDSDGCNDRVWSDAGYRPANMEGYYEEQYQMIADHFETKALAYELIQDGFPRINDAGGYWDETGHLTAGMHRIPYSKQTETFIAIGSDATNDYHERFLVQHNGLQPVPAASCPDPHISAAGAPGAVGSGCPNSWAVAAGADGQPTGYQTLNLDGVATLTQLDSALVNAEQNSLGRMVEIYEELAWLARKTGGPLDPGAATPRTLAQWDALYRGRASGRSSHAFFVSPALLNGPSVIQYINPFRCGATTCPTAGTIVVHR